jgi:hypothetical protein
MQLRRLESRTATKMLMSPKIRTTLQAAAEPIKSAAALAAIVAAALALAAALTPQKRVGVDWERRQFMLRGEGQGPIIPEPPHGPVWYVEPQARRI